MKNFIFLFVALMATMCVMTSCSSDSSDEPTVTSLPNTAWILESAEEWDSAGDYTYDKDCDEIYVFNTNGTLTIYGEETNYSGYTMSYTINGNTLTYIETMDDEECIYTGEYKITGNTMTYDCEAYWVDDTEDTSRMKMKFKQIPMSEVDSYITAMKTFWDNEK